MPAKTLTLSPSGLEAFFQCPARYQYAKAWAKVKLDPELKDGVDAHALMAGEDYHTVRPSTVALNFVAKLHELLTDGGYTRVPGWSERKLTWPGPRAGLTLRGIVDDLAWVDGRLVVIDYKTGTWPWFELPDGTAPKAAGSFQGVVYTTPPAGFQPSQAVPAWPEEIHYLTVSQRGPSKIYRYRQDAAGCENLAQAVGQVGAAKVFPKHRGSHCRYCPFVSKCLDQEQPGEYTPNTRAVAWEGL